MVSIIRDAYFFRWYGIELDEPLGRHDGTVEEVRYFAAPDDHGVFVTEARLTKLHNQPPKPGKTISDEHESQTFRLLFICLQSFSLPDFREVKITLSRQTL